MSSGRTGEKAGKGETKISRFVNNKKIHNEKSTNGFQILCCSLNCAFLVRYDENDDIMDTHSKILLVVLRLVSGASRRSRRTLASVAQFKISIVLQRP